MNADWNKDEIDVIYPSMVEPHPALTDTVTRGEFLARMEGTGAADQLKEASRSVCVIALLESESLFRWLTTRPKKAR